MTLLKKLQSRKLIVTIALIVIYTLGVSLPGELLTTIAVYLGGQAAVDAAEAFRGGN